MKEEILTQNQIAFLKKIKNSKFLTDNFYLTGGTALAAFYLYHRYSEDLDFFAENEFDILNLDIFLNQIKKELGILKIDFQQSYNRNLFFLHFKDEVLKTEFTFFPFKPIENGEYKYDIKIDSLIDIAVNKLFTIYQRCKARDYIDLYFICKEKGFSIDELIKKAKIKFDWHIDPVQLGTQFIKSKEAMDYPRMIKNMPNEEWQDFFIEEAKNFKKEIIE
ncbi:MAG: hypothetical protein CVV37_00985 [Nitrospira bacterium HGW-Nitrospira-1]|nr:MAG: hypothetical protein CVV37_00985 [Nitrospira bacterium HGW-Nitrospira-1]